MDGKLNFDEIRNKKCTISLKLTKCLQLEVIKKSKDNEARFSNQ